MGRVYQRAAQAPRVVVFADGEDERQGLTLVHF
jgi:phosphotransacetylase